MVTISCACGETRFEVPCGTEADKKPPKCPKPCDIAPLCRHASIRKMHRCHYGACPTCRLICEEEFPCGHKCKLRCHGPKPPLKPEFTLRPKKKKVNQKPECTPGSPCPSCPELVWRSCLGQHMGAERMIVCSARSEFSCDNLCGNLLMCGNHYCTKSCHAIKSLIPTSGLRGRSESCEDCDLPCQKGRKLSCPHPCPQPCHPGECPTCTVLIKRSCHCGAMVHVFECTYYNSLSVKEQLSIRSCRGPCHKKLPNCFHLCPETCHPGPCPSPQKCGKKVTVRCACQNLKKEWICQDVQAAYCNSGRDPKDISKNQIGVGLLSCSSECTRKLKVVDSELQLRKPKVLENKGTDVTKPVTKRRKRRERAQDSEQISMLQAIGATFWRCLILASIVLVVIATIYFGYKGILFLSDWMDEIEAKRQRRQFPRIWLHINQNEPRKETEQSTEPPQSRTWLL